MKKIYTTILIAAAALVAFSSCADYADTDEIFENYESIEISEEMRTNPLLPTLGAFVFVAGDEVIIPAKYEIKDKGLKESDIKFEWFYGAEVVSTENSVNLGKVPAGRYSGMLVLTDTRYGSKYSKEFNFQVNASAYEDGWAVVTDDGTNSHLNYLTADPNTGEYLLIEDALYAATGKTLPSGITSIQYHMYNTFPQVFAIALAGPGKESSIEVKYNDMQILGTFANEFVDDNGVEFKSVVPMEEFVAACAPNGDFYLREEAGSSFSRVPHASFFPSRPVVIDGGLKVNHIASYSSVGNDMAGTSNIFAHDDLNGRSLMLSKTSVRVIDEDFYNDGIFEAHRGGKGYDGKNSYEDITFPDPWAMGDYNVLAMGGCGADMDFMADSKIFSIVYFLEKKSDGKKYIFAYDYSDGGWFGSPGIDLDFFFPLPSDITIDAASMSTCCMVGGGNNIMLFSANGNKDIYAFNALTGSLRKIYTAASPVTGLVLGKIGDMMASFGGTPTFYDERLVVGTEDGTILVIELNDSALAGGKAEVIQQFKSTTGKMTRGVFNPAQSMIS